MVAHVACLTYSLNWRGDPMITRFQEEEDEVKPRTQAEVDKLLANIDATGTYGKEAQRPLQGDTDRIPTATRLALSDVLSLQRA
jgi:hypothetical protein